MANSTSVVLSVAFCVGSTTPVQLPRWLDVGLLRQICQADRLYAHEGHNGQFSVTVNYGSGVPRSLKVHSEQSIKLLD